MTIRFDEAWRNALRVAGLVSESGTDVVVVRDMLGRISLIVGNERQSSYPEGLEQEIIRATGAFAGQTPLMRADSLFDPGSILTSPDLIIVGERSNARGRLALLDRGVVGVDWRRTVAHPPARRVALYGFKGGVGRSTATFMLARHLVSIGYCVLVIDLDLESPGVSALLQQDDDLAAHGIVDHLVEAAVGNERDLELVSKSRIIRVPGNGEAWLAAASGKPHEDYDYLAKLNRAYTDLPPGPQGESRSFGRRIDEAVTACERQVEELSRPPDVVLLDSRAGIHDIAAIAITQLASLSLLFASDSPQTWSGYRALFGQWRSAANRREIGERLKMVSALTPDADLVGYLARFRDHAQSCFADTLYEEADASDLEAFNYGVDDEEAPHSPLHIIFHGGLVGLDPTSETRWFDRPLIGPSFENFVSGATNLITEGLQ